MNILIVDDDQNCATLWARMLGKIDARLLFAFSLEEALAQMGEIPPPDLVLLDLKVPPHGAPQMLAAVDHFRRYNDKLVVIAVSGMMLEEIMEAVRKSGIIVQGMVSKSEVISQNNLLDAVKSAMGSSRGFQDSLAILEGTSDAIEKKRTDRIELPPTQPLTPDDSTRK